MFAPRFLGEELSQHADLASSDSVRPTCRAYYQTCMHAVEISIPTVIMVYKASFGGRLRPFHRLFRDPVLARALSV